MFTVGSLLAILCFLPGRTAAVSTRNILLFLGFGLHLALVRVAAFAAATKRYAVFQYPLEVLFSCHSPNEYLLPWRVVLLLMMEQAHAREGHGDAVFVASHDHMVVAY